jgi:hypothetical protein
MRLERWDTLGTQVHGIYKLFSVINFFSNTHRLGCDTLLTDLEGVGGMHNLRYEDSCFFSKYLRVTPLRCHGATVLITMRVAGSRSLVRSLV